MKKPEKQKTDNVGWILAMLFPKKGKPVPQPTKQAPKWMPPQTATQSQPAAPVSSTSKPASPPTASPQVSNFQPMTTAPKPAPPAKVSVSPAATKPPAKANPKPGGRSLPKLQKEKLGEAFFHITGVLSFVVNIILIIVLVILARQLFALKTLVGDNLLGGLYGNFILMDQAHIKTEIPIDREIPVQFNLPINQPIVVTLNEPTRINGAQVVINSGGLSINAPANIVLPAGTELPIQLNLVVPVNTTIPIKFNVPVDIALEKTDLHRPFVGLQQVVHPLYYILQPQVKSPADLPCGFARPFCNWFFR